MDQVARVDTCISLVADNDGEWTNRMQGGRDAQTYLERVIGRKSDQADGSEECISVGLKILYF